MSISEDRKQRVQSKVGHLVEVIWDSAFKVGKDYKVSVRCLFDGSVEVRHVSNLLKTNYKCNECLKNNLIKSIDENSKLCSKCNMLLPLNYFNKSKRGFLGRKAECKECTCTRWNSHYEHNRNRLLNAAKKYRNQNPEKAKEHRVNNKQKYLSYSLTRRSTQLNATPDWLTKEDFDYIEDLYLVAILFKIYSGVDYHIDHIIPLQGKDVCGLHVPWNLRVIKSIDNVRKGNRYNQEHQFLTEGQFV